MTEVKSGYTYGNIKTHLRWVVVAAAKVAVVVVLVVVVAVVGNVAVVDDDFDGGCDFVEKDDVAL